MLAYSYWKRLKSLRKKQVKEGKELFKKQEYIVAVYHVYTEDKESRRDLVEFLEMQGYECEEDNVTNREKVLNTRLPVVVNVIDRKYSMLHNVVCAAASIASNMLISEEEFYVLYKGRNCTFCEYRAAVKRALKRCVADEKEIPDLISRPDVEAVINSNYEGFLVGLDGCSPRETAESLGVEIE